MENTFKILISKSCAKIVFHLHFHNFRLNKTHEVIPCRVEEPPKPLTDKIQRS